MLRANLFVALATTTSLIAQAGAAEKAQSAANLEAAAFRAAADYSKQNEGLAVLVQRDGKRLFEEYHNGFDMQRAHHIYSGTKSFAPIVALVAESEGWLRLDEPVAETITEWRGDKKREKITVRHLLNFTSGLRINDRELHSGRVKDAYAASVACPAATPAGKRFRYGSCHLMVFGELIRRKLAAGKGLPKKKGGKPAAGRKSRKAPRDFVAFLSQRILDPIGCRFGRWIRDRKGNPALPFGAYLTARDWAKFGQLLVDDGRHAGKQLFPAGQLRRCFVGSRANRYYGLNFWLIGAGLHRRDGAIPKDVVSAAGLFNQKLYLVPSKKMVIVRYGKSGVRSRYSDFEFLRRVFAGAKPKRRGRRRVR